MQAWAAATRWVLFLTGTPMENRVAEFRVLIRHLRPDIAEHLDPVTGALGGARFRQAIAPVYLRRNQADVLDELPPRLETQEWVELDGMAFVAYKKAVADGNFMAMRRALLDAALGHVGAQVHHVRQGVRDQGRHLGGRGLRIEEPLHRQGRLLGQLVPFLAACLLGALVCGLRLVLLPALVAFSRRRAPTPCPCARLAPMATRACLRGAAGP